MTSSGLLAMRKAAALAFAVPGLEVDLLVDGELLARVERRFDCRGLAPTTTLLSPCMFRAAVGRAHTHASDGGMAMFPGLATGVDPAVRYHMPFTGAVKPLGLVVSRVGETVVHVFATECRAAAVEIELGTVATHPFLPGRWVNTVWDPVTGIRLVFSEVRVGLLQTVRPFVEATMDSMMLRLAVGEITDAVAAHASRTDR